jgi:hypothetical protein
MITLDELEAMLARATPGPWFTDDDVRYTEGATIGGGTLYTAHTAWTAPAVNDDKLIAAARNALPELIRLAREALAAREKSDTSLINCLAVYLSRG